MGNLKNLFWSRFSSGIGVGVLGVILPLYIKAELNTSLAALGWIFAVYSLIFVLLQVPASFLGDRLNRRNILLCGSLLQVAAISIYGVSRSIWHFGLGKGVSGLGHSITRSPSSTLLVDICRRDRLSESFGNMIGFFSLGVVLGYFLAGPLSEAVGYRAAVLSVILFELIGFFYLYKIKYTQKTRPIKLNIKKFFKKPHRNLKILALTGMLVCMVECMDATVSVIFLRDRFCASTSGVGLVLGLLWLSFGLTQIEFGKRLDRWGRRRSYVVGMSLAALGSFLIPYASSLPAVALFFIILGIGHGIGFPAIKGIIAEHTSDAYRSQNFGYLTIFESLGGFIGLPLMGWIADHAGFDVVYYLRAGVLLSAVVFVFLLVKDREGG